MDYEVDVDGRKLRFQLPGDGDERMVSIGDRVVVFDRVKLPDGNYSIILGSRVFDLGVETIRESRMVSGREGSCEVRVVDPRRIPSPQPAATGPTGLLRICAELPGRVIHVLVRPGDNVLFDQGLLVLEAMKMQNEIRAPASGVVREVSAREGATVSTGEFLLSIG